MGGRFRIKICYNYRGLVWKQRLERGRYPDSDLVDVGDVFSFSDYHCKV